MPDAWLLGRDAGLPFQGFFRARVRGVRAHLAIAGAVPCLEGLAQDHLRARAVEVLLRSTATGAWRTTDRHGLIARAWSLLAERLEEGQRAGMSVLMVGEDEDGVGVTGAGIGGAWAVEGGTLRRLVPRGHPLLGAAGLPDSVPGVLTLDRRPEDVLAQIWGQSGALPPVPELPARCGGRP